MGAVEWLNYHHLLYFWAVARYGKPGIVPRGETKAAVLPLPIAALRVDAETTADLKTSGLIYVADLASRPRAPFAARSRPRASSAGSAAS